MYKYNVYHTTGEIDTFVLNNPMPDREIESLVVGVPEAIDLPNGITYFINAEALNLRFPINPFFSIFHGNVIEKADIDDEDEVVMVPSAWVE